MEYAAAKRRNISHANKEGIANRKKLLVLDVNGLLADIVTDPDEAVSKRPICDGFLGVFERPFCEEFLEFCFQRFNVGVWTSAERYNVEHALDFLMRGTQHKLLFCWDRAHCTDIGFNLENDIDIFFVKDLRKLWEKKDPKLPWEVGEYDESNTLLVETYPHMAILNPLHTAIFPYPYRYYNTEDNSLGDLRIYLERLAVASESVPKFVSENSFCQPLLFERNPVTWEFYQKFLRRVSYERKAGDSVDAQCKSSSEPEAHSSTPLAAQTTLEQETIKNTISTAHTIAEPQTATDYQQDWPFIKQSPMWATIESLVLCLTPPQKPQFSPLMNTKELHREGLAIAHMMTYWNLVQSLPNLKLNDPIDIINDSLELLVDLETHGFDVDAIRGRLNELLYLNPKQASMRILLKSLKSAITKSL